MCTNSEKKPVVPGEVKGGGPMDLANFKKSGAQVIDWAASYMDRLGECWNPAPQVDAGWLRSVLPDAAPFKSEPFVKIMTDIEPVVLEGMTHWQHRQFFSYFPAGNSWPSVLGDVMSNTLGVNGTNWTACPALTELEMLVCDWVCRFLNLPKFFLSKFACDESDGAGVIQQSASESIFYSMVWAREDAVKKLRVKFPQKPRAMLLNMLVAYCNCECHCCVERGALMGCIHLKKLSPDNEGNVRGSTLRASIEEDMKAGLIPFFYCAIIGSTGTTSVDDIMQVGPICEEFGIWLHVDAAYAGSCFSCPEMRHLMNGFEYIWSLNLNCNKWMLVNFDCSLHWVRYAVKAIDPMVGWDEAVYKALHPPDLKHFATPATRRFRALKLWFVIRNYGVEGLRRYIRNHINLAKLFEMYVKRDDRFEVCGPVRFGLVAFRLKGLNDINKRLLDCINHSRKIHMIPSHFQDKRVIRFALSAQKATEKDVDDAWHMIDAFASVVLREWEKENGGDTAMAALYTKQHKHDELQAGKPDARKTRDEEEALTSFQDYVAREAVKRETMIAGVDDSAVDGCWDQANEETWKKFDEFLQQHPEATEDTIFTDPNYVPKVSSMLHLEILNATSGRNKKNSAPGALEGGSGGPSKAGLGSGGGSAGESRQTMVE